LAIWLSTAILSSIVQRHPITSASLPCVDALLAVPPGAQKSQSFTPIKSVARMISYLMVTAARHYQMADGLKPCHAGKRAWAWLKCRRAYSRYRHPHFFRPVKTTSDELSADLHAALVIGIRDYCAKTKQNRVVLGLSGGIDSALVAALAVDALGKEAVIGLLMPGPYSSAGSITDAEALATTLGIRSHTLSITDAHALMLSTLKPVFTDIPTGVAEENLQSRLRGVLVMAVANKLHAMALTTGNKSELATGYCTIYGDMNGGLAPIGDLYKTQIWDLSRWINSQAGYERIPVASIDKAPSAELRENQTDQDSLPPYDVLDLILKRYLDEGWSPDRIIQVGGDAAVVQRIVRLVELNEFKRRQAAPNLRVSSKAFGTGRRFPLARKI